MNAKILFAIDANLGFVVEDPVWQQFFNKHNIEIHMYDDHKKLIEDLKKNTFSFAYLPSANYFYFKSNNHYKPIANALFAANDACKISSLLIVTKHSPIEDLADLQGKSLGISHPFCTSNYFAPAILLSHHHYSIKDFFSQIKEVGAWQKQIEAVISGEVDATMIQEDIWYKQPSNTQKTKIITHEENLPSPLVISARDVDPTLKQELESIMFSYQPQVPPNTIFNGFIPYQKELVESFFSKATQAFT